MIETYREEIESAARSLARHHSEIKAFVRRYGERSSALLTLAARSCEGDRRAHAQLLESARNTEEIAQSLHLARALGTAAAPVLHEIITAYYGGNIIDAFV